MTGKLTPEEERIIRQAVQNCGPRTVADILHISRLAMSNALAGLDTTRGTLSLIRTHIKDLE